MKNHLLIVIGLLIITGSIFAQDDIVDKLTVPLSKPDEPVYLECGLMNGSITVTGYEGNQVEVEAVTRLKKLEDDEGERERSRTRSSESESTTKSKEGMFKIPTTSSALEVEEYNNRIEVDVESLNKTVDVTLKVPFKTSLSLSAHHNGTIKVDNVTGNMEIQNHHGSIYLSDISGSAIANSHHGKIIITFNKVDSTPMAFSSYHGDIDVSFPPTLKANVVFKTEQGEVYSDFNIQKDEKASQKIQEKSHDKDGRFKVRIERAYYGTINGGGPEITFNNYHGDIILRKNK